MDNNDMIDEECYIALDETFVGVVCRFYFIYVCC